MPVATIEVTTSADIPALQTVVQETRLFPSEMLPEMLAGFISGDSEDIWLTAHIDGVPVAMCFARPEELTNGTWNMLALAVLPSQQGSGVGGELVARLEDILKSRGQRVIIVDTSGTEEFAATRRFYEKNGYVEEARIRDFWDRGDDKVVFWKSLQ